MTKNNTHPKKPTKQNILKGVRLVLKEAATFPFVSSSVDLSVLNGTMLTFQSL